VTKPPALSPQPPARLPGGREPPKFGAQTFTCPRCGALAQQAWYETAAQPVDKPVGTNQQEIALYPLDAGPLGRRWERAGNLWLVKCFGCGQFSVWTGRALAWPLPVGGSAPNPAEDMPEDVREDYQEAASIVDQSPRAAAALLRLALEKLCNELGKSGPIDKMIGALVADGLPVRIQKALDVIRVVGNEAVHPGKIDLRDEPETAISLFSILNVVVERMITEERVIDGIFDSLPPEKLKAIEARDRKSRST
jgi:hypothetical protein